MSYTDSPATSATDRVRLNVGDTDIYEEALTDGVYQYLLDKNLGNEAISSIDALKYLVAMYAKYADEKTGGVFTKESDKFAQYKKLLDTVTKDPSFSYYKVGTPFAGGISYTDQDSNLANTDNRVPEFKDIPLTNIDGLPLYSTNRIAQV